jgi:hypothetical protein
LFPQRRRCSFRVLKDVQEDIRTAVDILVGMDGTVWKAAAGPSPIESARQAAPVAAERLEYLQPQLYGKPVQVASQVEITVFAKP